MVFNRLLSGWIFSKEEDPARFFRDVKAVSNGDRYSYRFTSTRRKPTTRQSRFHCELFGGLLVG
jgi:hypothetical protein